MVSFPLCHLGSPDTIGWFLSGCGKGAKVLRSDQSTLKDECSLEGLVLRLKLQYFGHLMRSDNSLEKTLKLAKIEGRRKRR